MAPIKEKTVFRAMRRRLRQLEARERLFRTVLDRIPDPIEIIDRNFNVLYLNAAAAKRSGRPRDGAKGEKCHRIFYNRVDPCNFCPAKRTFESGEQGLVILRDVKVTGDGPCFEQLLSLPVRDDGNAVRWVVEIAKDVTREREMEQQLINSERLVSLGEMTASIAHEFNNPLGIILGFAQDLLTEVDQADHRHASLKIIEEEARRLKKIMRDLVEFGRPSPAHFLPTDPQELIRKALDLVAPQLQRGNILSVIEVHEKLPPIWADPQQLQQVLINLFFNAIEAMPQGGTLTLRACSGKEARALAERGGSGHRVVISVADTGHGIELRDHSRIFQTFYTTKNKKGMGLGLSVCEGIVRAHGGSIRVDSRPGQGATFSISLPVDRRGRERHESDEF